MSIQKVAQQTDINFDVDGDFDESYVDDFDVDFSDDGSEDSDTSYSDDFEDEAEAKDKDKKDEDDLVVLESQPEEVLFIVPDLPGALDISDIPEPEIEVHEEKTEAGPIDDFDWKSQGGHSGFLSWLQKMINNTPKHSGRDVGGLERAMAYFESLLKEIKKAMRTDLKGEIDVNHCETISDGMYNALDRMEERIEQVQRHKYPKRFKTKKASWVQTAGLVKEAQKVPTINGITIVVPLFISRLARIMINGMVSAGHSLEDQYDELKKEYKLTDREEAELQQLLQDLGYPIRQDRGRLNQQVDQSRSDNFDWAANYYS